MKPLVKWSGGKKDELPKILPHIPEFYTLFNVNKGDGMFLSNDLRCKLWD